MKRVRRAHRSKKSLFILTFQFAIFLVWVIVTLEMLILAALNNSLYKSGVTFDSLRKEADDLTTQNMILTDKIASASSLLTIEKKAKDFGFSPINRIQYIDKR